MENNEVPGIIEVKMDFRERESGLLEILEKQLAHVQLCNLYCGDYIIQNSVTLERKTKDDFVLSIMDRRIFSQCARLKQNAWRSLIIIEGSPYETAHKMDPQAIRGAIVSITTFWQIPMLLSHSKENTARLMIMMGKQALKKFDKTSQRVKKKSKEVKKSSSFLLQGLPNIGQKRARRLLEHFGSPEKIMTASAQELTAVQGIGLKTARKIRSVIEGKSTEEIKEPLAEYNLDFDILLSDNVGPGESQDGSSLQAERFMLTDCYNEFM